MNIQILPNDLANQIAAGEVVERPASIVKELVENSIDAGATRISIEIEEAGKKSIRISDNGSGMEPEDAMLAFERHATSKIKSAGDLESIRSLGFRGEALPSIASISRVRMATGTGRGQNGTEVSIEGGGTSQVKEIAFSKGTTFEVNQVFYNTPARQKFLKRDSTEAAHITQVVQQQALAHPEIQFSLHHNGRQLLATLPTDQRLYRIAELFGAELSKELIRVEKDDGTYRIEGFISSPVYTRSNRNTQYCFINSRFVRDRILLSATQQGYSHLLPRGQHPVLFLFMTMDPGLLDVNVHPAKAEVRFAFQQDVYRFVSHAVQDALQQNQKSFTELGGDSSMGQGRESEPSYEVPGQRTVPVASSGFAPEPSQLETGKGNWSRGLEALYSSAPSEDRVKGIEVDSRQIAFLRTKTHFGIRSGFFRVRTGGAVEQLVYSDAGSERGFGGGPAHRSRARVVRAVSRSGREQKGGGSGSIVSTDGGIAFSRGSGPVGTSCNRSRSWECTWSPSARMGFCCVRFRQC